MAMRIETQSYSNALQVSRERGNPHSQDVRQTKEQRHRARFGRLQELDVNNPVHLQAYFSFLTDPRNRGHFSSPPETAEELKAECEKPGNHPLVGLNKLGEVIGGAMIEDAARNQHDHFLTKVAIDPDLQGRGLGTEMVRNAIDYACTHETYDRRPRRKLDIAIIVGIPGWEKMRRLVQSFGLFERVSELKNQVDVEVRQKDGTYAKVTKPTLRYEANLDQWRTIKGIT